MMEWEGLLPDDAGVVFFWRDADAPSGLQIRMLGWPKKEFVEHEGLWLTLRDLTEAHDVEELLDRQEVDDPPVDGDDPVLLKTDHADVRDEER